MPIILAGVLASLAHADEAAIRQAFAERYPHVAIKSVAVTAIPGLYEVFAGGQIVYVDERGDHLLKGPLLDTREKLNVTERRLEVLKAVKFDTLPFEQSIAIKQGRGERRIAVFADPDCPFCRQLEKELARMDNLTVHVFLLPLAELHPQAPMVARNIWCATDRAKAWRDYLLTGAQPKLADGVRDCAPPIAEIAALANELGINGTPVIVLPDGQRMEGTIPADRLDALLNGGKENAPR